MASSASVNAASQVNRETSVASALPPMESGMEDAPAGVVPSPKLVAEEIVSWSDKIEQTPGGEGRLRGRPRRATAAGAKVHGAELKRRYNREYMRQWRADPKHRHRDCEKRRESYCARKERNAQREYVPYTDERGNPVCGFCHKRRPQGEIARLRVCDSDPSGYVEVRIPYCGKC